MPLLFALTLCLGALLLFSVQPMIAKMVLPLLGGSPSVWTTCMLFFQVFLLLGYAYAHLGVAVVGIRKHAILHVILLFGVFAALPFGIAETAARDLASQSAPAFALLRQLTVVVGLPFFVVSTTAPLLQRWYALSGHRTASDPYFLYGASNLGSLIALLGYPLVVEPALPLARQTQLWAWGYRLLALLILTCAALICRRRDVSESGGGIPVDHLPFPRRAHWVALAFIPSSLMLGLTTYLSTDIAPVPLLWVVPLALYLLTFILSFARTSSVLHPFVLRVFPGSMMVLALVLGLGLVQPFWVPLHLLTFFLGAMVCHGELARTRPEVRHLTAFYLAVAVGGALGGVFNALVAPVLFNRIAEYPLALMLVCLMLPARRKAGSIPGSLARDLAIPAIILTVTASLVTGLVGDTGSGVGVLGSMLASGLVLLACWTHRSRPIRFGLSLGAVLFASGLSAGVNGRVLFQERNFFGVSQVTEDAKSRSHRLFHGRTLHGQQSLDPAWRREPLSYFRRHGPIGQVFDLFQAKHVKPRVAIVGLGAGTLACYARAGEEWTFYEIDPAIVRIAGDPHYFTFLADSLADRQNVVLGDAKIQLGAAPSESYGLVVLDAFSADAVPIHLLTREALRLYRSKLAPGGILAFQITNRYVDLDPVLGALARDAGLGCRIAYDLHLSSEEIRSGKQRSIWAIMSEREADLDALAKDPLWKAPKQAAGAVWRDDFSDLASHLLLRPR